MIGNVLSAVRRIKLDCVACHDVGARRHMVVALRWIPAIGLEVEAEGAREGLVEPGMIFFRELPIQEGLQGLEQSIKETTTTTRTTSAR